MMTTELLKYITDKQHHKFRKNCHVRFSKEFSKHNVSSIERMTERFERLMEMQTPVILPCELICFLRTTKNIDDCFTAKEWEQIKEANFIHELGYISNISPNYEKIIKNGLLHYIDKADEYGKRAIQSIIKLSDRYLEEAQRCGREDIAATLKRVPRYGASSFREALQMFRIIHFSLWLEGNYHITVGRFDKYMYPYLKADMDAGILDEDSALELVEDFFISFNKDADLYPGVQQGDNGQSMVLGGTDENGNEVFNLLSKLCLKASKNLMLIDPKINLRVNKNTPIEVYELGSELTKAGLGFPQYSNDDVVINGLIRLGYEYKDAVNYTTAACWEFIIPNVGCDVANIDALSFPKIIDICVHTFGLVEM